MGNSENEVQLRPRRKPGRPRLEQPSPEFVARQSEIIDVATRIFHLKGYDSGSLDDVATELDLRKASLYHYVRSKSHLLYLIFDRAITLGLEQIEKIGVIEDPHLRMIQLIRNQALTIAAQPGAFTVFFDQRPHLDEDHESVIRAKERAYLDAFVKGVVDCGLLAGEADPRYVAHAVIGMTTWVYKWIEAGDDPEVIADVCVKLMLPALCGAAAEPTPVDPAHEKPQA